MIHAFIIPLRIIYWEKKDGYKLKMSRRDYILMANTYTQIHIRFVFAVKFRQALINKEWKEELYKYITGIIKNNNHKLLAINGISDHVHILIEIKPTQSISDLMKNIKQDSSKWINKNKFLNFHFEWQEGYGAFSYSKSQLAAVINCI